MISLDEDRVTLPEWVDDLESFRRWTDDDAFPEHGKISFLDGRVLIDRSKEQLFTHNGIKTEITVVLGSLAKRAIPGRFFPMAFFSATKVRTSPTSRMGASSEVRHRSKGESALWKENPRDMWNSKAPPIW